MVDVASSVDTKYEDICPMSTRAELRGRILLLNSRCEECLRARVCVCVCEREVMGPMPPPRSVLNVYESHYFKACELPVRTAKFIARQSWLVFGCDDAMIHVFNYQTLANIHTFLAHSDYIRCIVVHPIKSYILNDLVIKLWDWSKDWCCIQTYEAHAHYVMQVIFNPKDDTMFASASLDRTLKVWNVGNTDPNFTLSGHEKGVNSVHFCHTKDKPYIVSGADDCTIKVWDYQNRTCVHTLQEHNYNVTFVLFHPTLPLLLSASEDGNMKIWNTSTFHLDSSHNYGYERAWTICATDKNNDVIIGYDEGVIVIKIGKDRPSVSMDANSGKIVSSRHSEIRQVNVKTISEMAEKDGDILHLVEKDMGTCEIYPQHICHSRNGRFLAVCDGEEYVVYTSLALRTKCFGRAKQFVWGDGMTFAVLDDSRSVAIYVNFVKHATIKANNVEALTEFKIENVTRSTRQLASHPIRHASLVRIQHAKLCRCEVSHESVAVAENWHAGEKKEGSVKPAHYVIRRKFGAAKFQIFGGRLLGVKTDVLSFYEWEKMEVVNAIEVAPQSVYWSADGERVCLKAEKSFYILMVKYQDEIVFELLAEIKESVNSGLWINNSFIYTDCNLEIRACIEGATHNVARLDKEAYILGYVNEKNRLYLCDRESNVLSYYIPLPVLDYEAAVLKRDMETSRKLLHRIPEKWKSSVAHFLDDQCRRDFQATVEAYLRSRLRHAIIALLIIDGIVYRYTCKTYKTNALLLVRHGGEERIRILSSELNTVELRQPIGFKQEALALSTELEHRFELALSIDSQLVAGLLEGNMVSNGGGRVDGWRRVEVLKIRLQQETGSDRQVRYHNLEEYIPEVIAVVAFRPVSNLTIAEESAAALNTPGSWSRLGCAAGMSDLELANKCFQRAGHYAAVLLYAVSAGDKNTLQEVAKKSSTERQFNVAFLANFLLANLEECVQLLLDNGQPVEAAFFARSYIPSRMVEAADEWRKKLTHKNAKMAASIADPSKYINLFPEYESQQLDGGAPLSPV
ncbi:Coatomer subunit beta' [Eumeta japonica]|uniref:Beta'-coat protein n=1 Tax=Eumeta variegata TaxID=151549 RepID=A0A4C1VUY1_EUMVA|nr:Coatomer subunit beta' [Eumeta japonica]